MSNTTNIFTPSAKPFNLTYQDHAKNFWKWLVSIPKTHTPESDLTGEHSATGQTNNSPIFFLSIGPNRRPAVKRSCTISNGKGILIPVMVVVVSDKEVPEIPNPTINDLRRKAKKDQDSVTNMHLRIDNEEFNMDDLKKYRIHTGVFNVKFPKNALWDLSEGPAKAIAGGHYIITKSLPKGEHTIHWKSELKCIDREGEPKCIDNSFIQDIKYTVEVK